MASKSSAETAVMVRGVKTDIGVKDDARKKLVETLNLRLCDEYVLYTKTRNYHWNVIGPRFSQLHEFFRAVRNPGRDSGRDGGKGKAAWRQVARDTGRVCPAFKHKRTSGAVSGSTDDDIELA
jgi:hypothetical protein